MPSDSDREPQRRRLHELLGRVRDGTASEAEREELALYAEDDEDVAEAVARAERERELGGTWLARAEADRRIEAAGKTRFVKAERAVGAALTIGGTLGAFIAPPLGLAALAGLGILGLSALRVHLKSATKDPYRDIDK
jgi:ferric-dicitrate binding protein FerR (iron transport regulator)